jgi:hypothetical protein
MREKREGGGEEEEIEGEKREGRRGERSERWGG